jgi:4-nitrophenyl phosphatase
MTPSLAQRYDALLLDLDGVVYRGDEVIPAASAVLEKARTLGAVPLFMTNNSSRTPDQVAEKLGRLGVRASAEEVMTSAQATAAMLESEGSAGLTSFVIGERGIREALEAVGVRILDGDPDRTDLVVVGWDRSVDYPKLRRAALLVQHGARLVATNADASYPAPDGMWPGAGALLASVVATTGATPTIVGKPARPMFEAAARRVAAARGGQATDFLVVGDRTDTDIAGAAGMGWDSLLVLTGASRPADLLRVNELPTYVGADLSMLLHDPPPGRFRRANRGDVPALAELLSRSGLSNGALVERVDSTVVCFSPNGDAAATACVEVEDGFGILRSVAVQERFRGQGLGMLAVAAAVRSARSRPLHHLSLFTETASRFFERLGFQPVSRTDLPASVQRSKQAAEECSESAIPMVLPL